jgi:hypothetical protein
VSNGAGIEDLLRELAPQVLGAVVRRYGNFDLAEDATQEALLAAVGPPIEDLLGDRIYSRDGSDIETVVGRQLRVCGATATEYPGLSSNFRPRRDYHKFHYKPKLLCDSGREDRCLWQRLLNHR